MASGAQFLADLVHYRTYAAILPDGRKESRRETIDRCKQMHLDKFGLAQADQIHNAFEAVHNGMVVPSMRTLQFSGDAVRREPARAYNCSYTAIKRFKDFADCLYLLCCGTGFGFSAQRMFINNLPAIQYGNDEELFAIPDSKEGWADSIMKLLENPRVNFYYDYIRPYGAPLSSGGWASGPEPLRKCHELIRLILLRHINSKLSPLEVADIICYIADAIVVAGTRRSALICLFDPDDEEMLSAKAGNWWEQNPQRARMNMSAVVHRQDPLATIKAQAVVQSCFRSGTGEPGLYWTNDFEYGANPCQPEFATVLTPDGIRTFAEIEVGSTIWSGKRWTKVTAKWKTGTKPVFEYRTTAGKFIGTGNHRILQCGEKVEVQHAEGIDACQGEIVTAGKLDAQDVMDGLVLGDGSVHKASNNLVYLCIGENDYDYFDSEVKDLITFERDGLSKTAWEVTTTIEYRELKKTYEREVPERFFKGDTRKKLGFLRGLYSANGSVCGNRVTLKSASFSLVSQVQEMLSSVGIRSYYTVNAAHDVEFGNGTYTCKKSYDLNITSDRMLFISLIGFIQSYKAMKIKPCKPVVNKSTYGIHSITPLGEMEVWDITVDDEEHTYWTGGCHVSNCCEISLRAFCNLTEVNVAACQNKDDLMKAVWAATYIGTLQATYTDFSYIHSDWKKYADEEALLGVSLTGQAMNWPLLSSDNLRAMGALAVTTNREYAYQLGINEAHRLGTTKPSGSTSAWLGRKYGVPSGVHSGHGRRHLRSVRVDINNPLGAYLLDNYAVHAAESGEVLEFDKFNSHNIVVTMPIEMNGCIIRDDESAIQLMNRARHIHENWIRPTHNKGPNTHNVSLTVSYKPEEEADVLKWMLDNRDSYAGMALLPFDGGSYVQAPFRTVSDAEFESFQRKFDSMNIDLAAVNWLGHSDQRMGESACGGGQCEVA